jgi:hypothetical protein
MYQSYHFGAYGDHKHIFVPEASMEKKAEPNVTGSALPCDFILKPQPYWALALQLAGR